MVAQSIDNNGNHDLFDAEVASNSVQNDDIEENGDEGNDTAAKLARGDGISSSKKNYWMLGGGILLIIVIVIIAVIAAGGGGGGGGDGDENDASPSKNGPVPTAPVTPTTSGTPNGAVPNAAPGIPTPTTATTGSPPTFTRRPTVAPTTTMEPTGRPLVDIERINERTYNLDIDAKGNAYATDNDETADFRGDLSIQVTERATLELQGSRGYVFLDPNNTQLGIGIDWPIRVTLIDGARVVRPGHFGYCAECERPDFERRRRRRLLLDSSVIANDGLRLLRRLQDGGNTTQDEDTVDKDYNVTDYSEGFFECNLTTVEDLRKENVMIARFLTVEFVPTEIEEGANFLTVRFPSRAEFNASDYDPRALSLATQLLFGIEPYDAFLAISLSEDIPVLIIAASNVFVRDPTQIAGFGIVDTFYNVSQFIEMNIENMAVGYYYDKPVPKNRTVATGPFFEQGILDDVLEGNAFFGGELNFRPRNLWFVNNLFEVETNGTSLVQTDNSLVDDEFFENGAFSNFDYMTALYTESTKLNVRFGLPQFGSECTLRNAFYQFKNFGDTPPGITVATAAGGVTQELCKINGLFDFLQLPLDAHFDFYSHFLSNSTNGLPEVEIRVSGFSGLYPWSVPGVPIANIEASATVDLGNPFDSQFTFKGTLDLKNKFLDPFEIEAVVGLASGSFRGSAGFPITNPLTGSTFNVSVTAYAEYEFVSQAGLRFEGTVEYCPGGIDCGMFDATMVVDTNGGFTVCGDFSSDFNAGGCVDFSLFQRQNGEACALDNQCVSGFCSVARFCRDKLGNGEACLEDDDCESGFCSGALFCRAKLGNGEICLEDDDCVSGFCSVASGKRCKAKLGNGEICIQHNDCVSGYCGWVLVPPAWRCQ